jgi:hypothetical protein
MNDRITFSILVAVLFAFLCIAKAQAQEDDCNKTKVAVSVKVLPKIWSLLENDFGSHPQSEWNSFVTKMLVQILSEFEPGITFFPLGEGNGDYHYHFRAELNLIPVEENEIEVGGYWIYATLIANANCIPSRSGELQSSMTYGKDRMLNQAMKNLVSTFWPMDRNIVLYEEDHPSPPRKPELNIQIEKDFISPINKESRKTIVYAKVYNCRGELVCDKKGDGQPVYYQDKIDRLDLKNIKCEGGNIIGNFMVIITNKKCENEGEYNLEKGMDAEKKTILFRTCQLGGPIVEEKKELIIRGLKIEVKPDRREIEPDERTKIIITLNETDPDGSRYPVEGKEIEVKISGLENGTIKPENGYTTTSDGKVVLDYKAGSNDKKVTVNASFQPEDYPDKAEGKGSVMIKKPEGDFNGTITYRREVHWKDESTQPMMSTMTSVNLNESATFQVAAKYLKTTTGDDGPEELFEASPLSGNYSVTMKKVVTVTDENGHWQKKEDTWQGNKMLDPKSGSNIFLTIMPQNKSYRLQIEFHFPPVEGNTVITSDGGVNMTNEAEGWAINAGLEFEGKTDGNSVNGNWSKPAPPRLLVLPQAGLMPGSTWNWNLSRKK